MSDIEMSFAKLGRGKKQMKEMRRKKISMLFFWECFHSCQYDCYFCVLRMVGCLYKIKNSEEDQSHLKRCFIFKSFFSTILSTTDNYTVLGTL